MITTLKGVHIEMNKFIGSLNTMLFGVLALIAGIFKGFLLYIDSSGLLKQINYLGYTKSFAIFSYTQFIIFSILYIISGNSLIYNKKWAERYTLNIAKISLFINLAIFIYLIFNLKADFIDIWENHVVIRINIFHLIGGVLYPTFLVSYFKKYKK